MSSRISEAVVKLTVLIHRIMAEMVEAETVGVRAYGIKDDFVSFEEEGLGGLLLANEDAKEYRRCVDEIYAGAAGKAERISRSAVASLIQRAMLKALDATHRAAEKDFAKRLAAAIVELRHGLKAKPVVWETHLPADLLPDKLPYAFGRCEFYLGDDTSVHRLLQRIGHPKGQSEEGTRRHEISQFVQEAVNETIRGKVVVSAPVHAVDATAAQILGQKLIRQTVDILSFFANLGGQACSQILLPEDSRPAIAKVFLFSEEIGERHAASTLVGPIAPFSFAGPHLHPAGLKRTSEMLKREPPSEFDLRLLSALQWAGKASVEPRIEDAFLLFAVSMESLLLERNEKSEIAETLALRLAHLISGPGTRLMVYRDMKKLYGIRSKIVHSGSFDVGEDQLSEIRYYTRVALLTMLLSPQLSGLSTDRELTDWFRSRLLDLPIGQERT
jgi:hypothetical protein